MDINDIYLFFLEETGWLLFFLIAFIVFIIIFVHSQLTRSRALIWLILNLICLFTFTLAALYDLGPEETRTSLQGLRLVIFYSGFLGGIIPILLLIGYVVTRSSSTSAQMNQEFPPMDVDEGFTQVQATEQQPFIPPQQPRSPINDAPTQFDPQGKAGNTPIYANAWLIDYAKDRKYPISTETTQVGRGNHNDLVLVDDPAISGSHFVIQKQGNNFLIQDVGSRFGTSVNGIRISKPTKLTNNSKIVIGDTELTFVGIS